MKSYHKRGLSPERIHFDESEFMVNQRGGDLFVSYNICCVRAFHNTLRWLGRCIGKSVLYRSMPLISKHIRYNDPSVLRTFFLDYAKQTPPSST